MVLHDFVGGVSVFVDKRHGEEHVKQVLCLFVGLAQQVHLWQSN